MKYGKQYLCTWFDEFSSFEEASKTLSNDAWNFKVLRVGGFDAYSEFARG